MRKLKSFIVWILIISITSCSVNSFDSEDWKANKNRPKQINSLINSKILIGKSFDEVIKLLGTEDLLYQKSDTSNKEFRIQYLTGKIEWIDFERLLIIFENGKAIKAEKNYD